MNEYKFFAAKIISEKEISQALEKVFDEGENKINGYLHGVAVTRELTARTLDAILSFGEYFALHTVHHFLREKSLDIQRFDSTSVLISDSNYGNANPMIDQTNEKVDKLLKPALDKYGAVVTQGFVAKDTKGEVTTMGIESSNLTATLLAGLLGAKSITFFTDVEGICTSDPKITKNPLTISSLNYDDAYRLAARGLKLIYPPMIDLARENGIELIYRSAFKPEGNYTKINDEKYNKMPQVTILRSNLNLFRFSFNEFAARREFQEKFAKFLELNDHEFYFDSAADSLMILTDKSKFIIDPNITYEKFQNVSSVNFINIEEVTFYNLSQEIRKFIEEGDVLGIYYYSEEKLANLVVRNKIDKEILEIAEVLFK